MESKAYPNYDYFIGNIYPSKDLNKWIDIAKKIYNQIHNGVDYIVAFDNVTKDWDDMEKSDFSNWLKYYMSNNHKKYSVSSFNFKKAQVNYWDDINQAGYFVTPKVEDEVKPEVQQSEKQLIENHRSKILSRLDSAEKLLRQQEGHNLAGSELSSILRAIYDLKERIHILNKKSFSNKTYHDLIIRQSNILRKEGFIKGCSFLTKIADDLPPPESPPLPMNPGGLPGNLPGEAPGLKPSVNDPPKADKLSVSPGMEDFLSGLKGELESNDLDDLNLDDLIVEAQVQPPPPLKEENLEVEEKHINKIDSTIEQALKNVTIEDIVQKLEDNTKIYKTRQLARELSLIDMMLDQLGLASFFPSLAEATNKALDANQYILTRLEDITARLKGSTKTNDIDLTSKTPQNPQIQSVKHNLENQEEKDKSKKEMRKKLEDEKLIQKEPVNLEVEEDLKQPVTTPTVTAPKSPIAPTPVK